MSTRIWCDIAEICCISLREKPSMDEADFTIRRLSSAAKTEADEWQAVHTLCCLTGNDGDPIAEDRWEFFSRIWIGPYQQILPHWTYVVEQRGVIAGYLTGCPDTRAFRRTKFFCFDLPLLVKIVCQGYAASPDKRRFLRRTLGLENDAVRCFPYNVRRTIERDYPAHLHMNVDRFNRHQGVGRRLIERYVRDLQETKVAGIHVYCGPRPVPFYQKIGFQGLGTISYNGVSVHVLGYRGEDSLKAINNNLT